MPAKRKPSYTLHKSTGQARVRIDGKDHYLGTFGSHESRERYDELLAEWLTRQDLTGATLTLDDLCLLFLDFSRRLLPPKGRDPNGHGQEHSRVFEVRHPSLWYHPSSRLRAQEA